LVIDSHSMEWVGLGGVLDWQAREHQALGNKDSTKGLSWVKPKVAHKAMVYSLLQRRMPIIFSIRGEETFVPPDKKIFKPITNKMFPFEVTLSFRLESDRKGYIDLKDPGSYKMEGAHQAIFRDGDRISEEHGRAIEEWARGVKPTAVAPQTAASSDTPPLVRDGAAAANKGRDALQRFWDGLTPEQRRRIGRAKITEWEEIATERDRQGALV
jgi:hypothetical protein